MILHGISLAEACFFRENKRLGLRSAVAGRYPRSFFLSDADISYRVRGNRLFMYQHPYNSWDSLIVEGGKRTHLLLALVVWLLTTRPLRDGAPFLIDTLQHLGAFETCVSGKLFFCDGPCFVLLHEKKASNKTMLSQIYTRRQQKENEGMV